MNLEKRLESLRVLTRRAFGLISIAFSVYLLVTLKELDSPIQLMLRFSAFIATLFLGLSYLGEKHD